MSKNAIELCVSLVADVHGDLPAQILQVLLECGRLSLVELDRQVNIDHAHLRAGLVVLLQHDLLLYWSPAEGVGSFFEANLQNAYSLVRLGKLARLVGTRLGKGASHIVSRLQCLGIAKAQDLTRQEPVGSNVSVTNGRARTNGDSRHELGAERGQDQAYDSSTLSRDLKRLLEARIVQPLVDTKQFMTETDLHLEAAAKLRDQDRYRNKMLAGKEKKEYEDNTRRLIRKWRRDHLQYKPSQSDSEGENEQSENLTKRRKLNGGTGQRVNSVRGHRILEDSDDDMDISATEQDLAWQLDEDASYRLSHDKMNVLLRSDQLTDLAARCIGDATSKVYSALLRCLELKLERCFAGNDDYEQFHASATTSDILAALTPGVDLSSTLRTDFVSLATHSARPVNGIKREHDSAMTENKPNQHYQLEQHLHVLAEHPHEFVSFIEPKDGEGRGYWSVDFERLTWILIQQSLDTIIAGRFGQLAKRLVRVLLSQGKLDEKTLATKTLTRQKDLRATLTAMQDAGFAETQEVPKDNTRQPSRIIYLWFFDADRCRRLILDDTYKLMARLMQRAKVEKEKVRAVIDKAERTDVLGHEDTYLTATEREALAAWRRREEKLLTQLSRQDDLVALLRDFLPP